MAGNVRDVTVRWRDGLRFEGAAPGRPAVLVDGDSVDALSPVELLLVAAATCTGADVVSILRKQRVDLRALAMAVRGTRRETHPRRYTAIHVTFTITGGGADEAKARRAIDLSLQTYCSVVASLAADLRVTYDVVRA
ncbi:MAG: OsmC family protein [Gemmatimonadales bacterium]